METKVRMADHSDIERLIKSRFDYFDAENWEVTIDKRAVIESNLKEYFIKHLNEDFFAAIVEVNDKIASIAFLAISEKPANLSFPTGKTGTVFNVLTYPEHRKKGCATHTMKALIEEAKKQSLSYVELSASEAGKPLYEKLGFQEKKVSHFIEMKLSLL